VEVRAVSPSDPEAIPNDTMTPLTAEDLPPVPRTRMAPQEALERLGRGETLQDVRIDRLPFKGDFPRPVRLVNVYLCQPQFDGAAFAAEVSFVRCTLERPRFNRPSAFADNFILTGSTLAFALLRNLTVKGKFACDHVVCRGQFLVVGSRFEGPVRFWEAHFRGWAELKECEFQQEADLRSFHAAEGFVMTRCRCAGDVLFRGCTVSKKWDGQGTRFEGLLDFSKAKLNDFVYLEGIEQGPKQRFAFANALAERLLIGTAQLEDRLASELTDNYEVAMHEYALLKRSFASLHRFDAEDWAYYRFKVSQRKARPRSWLCAWTKAGQVFDWLLLDHGCGYGTNPYRAVRAGFLIIVLFAAIYAAGIDRLHIDKTPFEGATTDPANRVVLGLFTSVSVFTSGLAGIRDVARGAMNVALIVEALLGTILWGLFIVAFSRKVIR
jgi:hypothetical protein